ncbi:multidrug effflux MFS transporter [Propioniciclava soli]|uniref:multidrug effflux MFS transporter n=1 Tax=Propioniciclava soli TaxID=2775081 RepID=UPI001E3CCD9F
MPTTTSTRQPSHGMLLVTLAALGMVGPFSIDTMFPAFTQMGESLGVGSVALQQLISVYMLAFGTMSLFHGPISDAVGRKPVIIVGGLLYTAASVGCALSPNLGLLLVFRALQGASAGAGQIISRAMVSDLFPRPVAQRVMSHIAMIFGLAPALAPVVGGWLLLAGDWTVIFWFLAVFGLLVVGLTVLVLPESHPAEARSPLRVGPLFSGLVAVWRDPAGRRLAFAGMTNFAGMFLYISSAPLIVVTHLGGGEQDFWWLFFPLIGGLVFGSWVAGRLAGRLPGTRIATIGYLVSLGAGSVNLVLTLIPATQGLPWAVLVLPVYSFGIALAFPILTLEMLALFPSRRGAASSVQSFVQLMSNAVIAGVLAPFVGISLASLAATALAFTGVGWVLWRRHLAVTHDAAPA